MVNIATNLFTWMDSELGMHRFDTSCGGCWSLIGHVLVIKGPNVVVVWFGLVSRPWRPAPSNIFHFVVWNKISCLLKYRYVMFYSNTNARCTNLCLLFTNYNLVRLYLSRFSRQISWYLTLPCYFIILNTKLRWELKLLI